MSYQKGNCKKSSESGDYNISVFLINVHSDTEIQNSNYMTDFNLFAALKFHD